jgi:NADH-quinone oxidoreductase subunit H
LTETNLVIVILILFSYEIVSTFYEWVFRKVVARLQGRIGPLYAGPSGVLQPIADFIKLLGKEDITNRYMDPIVEIFSVVVVILTTLSMTLLPFPEAIFTNEFSLLALVAFITVESLLVFFAALGTSSAYGTIGGMRLANQTIVFKIPLVLSLLAVGAKIGTFDVLVLAQTANIFVAPIAFVVFLVASLAELSLVPFDTPEAESEIVGGWWTEMSGTKLALFRFNHDLKFVLMAFLTTTVFLGGGSVPIFFIKSTVIIVLLAYIHATSGRLRIDQLSKLLWKYGIPLAILQMVVL